MGDTRDGTYAVSERSRLGARDVLSVVCSPVTVMIGVQLEFTPNPGFTRVAALDAGRSYAGCLHTLSGKVADQQPGEPPNLDTPKDVYKQQLKAHEDSLCLDRATSLKTLIKLRKLGAGLYAELPENGYFLTRLRDMGFPDATAQEDPQQPFPALSFTEVDQAPILWEMLYEGSQEGLPEWERFWGFRFPITHWTNINRNGDIRLQGGMFSATNEDLDFAGQEVVELQQHAGVSLRQFTLADMLRARVREKLVESKHLTEQEAEDWLTKDWLHRFLAELEPDPDLCQVLSDQWKRDALIDAFKRPPFRYDLIHFACHCQAGDKTEFLSQLEMKVAGEPIALEVSLMASDGRREWQKSSAPGPLVFLNACGTAQQGATYEPPGFPQKWIQGQGALAVIATLCPVPNYFAHAFARKFYEILFTGIAEHSAEDPRPEIARQRFVADALLSTRRFFMKPPYNNPLGLAYVLYGYSGVQVRTDFPGGPA
jgi:hypothetical protein